MGQLIIKYNSKNTNSHEVKRELKLAPDEAKELNSLNVKEIILDNQVFVPKSKREQ